VRKSTVNEKGKGVIIVRNLKVDLEGRFSLPLWKARLGAVERVKSTMRYVSISNHSNP
jgi:hypothetical protein